MTAAWFSTVEASGYLLDHYGIRRVPKTLTKLRCTGGGPRFQKAGPSQIIYSAAELDEWARSILSPLKETTNASA